MPIYKVTHLTKYTYQYNASVSYNEARVTLRSFQRALYEQQVVRGNVKVTPKPIDSRSWVDYFGNEVHHFSLREPYDTLSVVSNTHVEIIPNQVMGVDGIAKLEQSSATCASVKSILKESFEDKILDARQYIYESPYVPIFEGGYDYAAESLLPDRPMLEAVHDLMTRIYTEFSYDPNATTISTPVETVLKEKAGVCQDFAHFMIACLRSHGLAARYVSGYLETIPPEGTEKLQGSDASHAWVSVFEPTIGWVDYDPTNNQLPTHQHITIGWGRDFIDLSPLKGVYYGGGEQELIVEVDVNRV